MTHTITIAKQNSNILELADSEEKISIIAEQDAEITIIDKNTCDRAIEILAKNNSKINFVSFQNSNKNTISIKRNAILENNSVINWLDCNFGNASYDCETTTLLKGDNSASNTFCLFLGNNIQSFDLKNNSIHEGKNTSSEILTRGVLNDDSKAKCRGLLQVNNSASNSSSYQKFEILLLNAKAKAECIPELKINSKEVKKCGHGAAITQVDGEKLFYLMSRGISKDDAVKKIVEGFFLSIIKKANINNLNAELQNMLENKLESK